MLTRLNKEQSGFTLVELAIVMIIIGILVGGILKGQELIQSARVKKVATQLESFQAAFYTFEGSVRARPGDIENANQRLPGCAANPICNLNSGNNDGVIGAVTTNWSRFDPSDLATENTQAWTHLALTGFIRGVSASGSQVFGDAYPRAAIGGGYQVASINETGTNQARGHYLMLRLTPTGDPHPSAPGQAVLSPIQVQALEAQLDDGLPNTGYIVTDDAGGRCWNSTTTQYVGGNDGTCIMAYRVFPR